MSSNTRLKRLRSLLLLKLHLLSRRLGDASKGSGRLRVEAARGAHGWNRGPNGRGETNLLLEGLVLLRLVELLSVVRRVKRLLLLALLHQATTKRGRRRRASWSPRARSIVRGATTGRRRRCWARLPAPRTASLRREAVIVFNNDLAAATFAPHRLFDGRAPVAALASGEARRARLALGPVGEPGKPAT